MPETKRGFPTTIMVIALIAAALSLSAAVAVIFTRTAPPLSSITLTSTRMREGSAAPNFALNTLDGKSFELSSLRGKKVVVNFWATWCPPCIEETPALIQAYEKLRSTDQNIEFVGVGSQDETDNLRKFSSNNKIPYIIVEDPEGKVGDAYGIRGMPMTFAIDSNGVVKKIWAGAVKKDAVIDFMRSLN
jgi:peroxiredoxin